MGIYEPNRPRDRISLWEELAGILEFCRPKWCIGRDFNAIRHPIEKLNGEE